MSLSPLFRRSQVRQPESWANRRHPRCRACIETLETRQLLSLGPAGSYAAFSSPSAIATADFNGDGKLDLATTVGIGNPRVSVRLGDGAGGFGAAQEFAFAFDSPSSIAVADFNNDNRLDLVVADSISFSVLLGNGDGTFQPPVMTVTGDFPQVVLGHFNNDANLDLVVGWYHWEFGLHYQPYLGNGQGGFTGGSAYQIGGAALNWGGDRLAAVELNHDGKLDVVISDGRTLLGCGNGMFLDGYSPPVPLSGGAIATGDFTGDGNADVIISGNSIAVLRSRGDGGLDAPVHHSMNGAYGAVATADFNVDGKLDAIAIDANVSGVSVMLGNGDGTLRFAGAFATGTTPSGVAVGDFNRDGRPDVAVANRDSSDVSVLLNDGDWTVLPPPPPPPPALSVGDVTVTEGNTGTRNAAFTVTLSKPAAADVLVSYGTQSGTATPQEDYSIIGGSVTIPAGQTSAAINIAVVGDRTPEPDETFSVILTGATNAMIADGQGVCTIVNDDVLPLISINNVSKAEGRSGTTAMTFTVSLSNASDQPVTVKYATANGTAKAGTDYTSKSGTLTFAPGETVKTVSVSVKGDATKEVNETFFVDLFGASGNALIGVARGTGTILDDDSIFR